MTVLPPVFGPVTTSAVKSLAESDVDRDDAAGQAGVARRQEDDLGTVRRSRPGPRPCRRPGGPSPPRSRTGRARRASRAAPAALAPTRADSSSRIRSISSCLGDLRLAPGVAELDGDERLDEQRLAAAGRVVDDALDPAPRLGLDRDDVAPVAKRDDRLLEGRCRAPRRRARRAAPEPVVGDPDRRPEPAEPRRRGVEQLADRVEAARERRAQRGQRVELAAELAEQRPPLVGERRREPRRRVERLGDLEELGRHRAGRRGRRARPPGRCRGRRRSRPSAAPRGARAPGRSRRGRAPTITGSLDGSSASARRRDGGNEVRRRGARGPAGTRGGRSSGVHQVGRAQRRAAGPDAEGWPAIDEPPRRASAHGAPA